VAWFKIGIYIGEIGNFGLGVDLLSGGVDVFGLGEGDGWCLMLFLEFLAKFVSL